LALVAKEQPGRTLGGGRHAFVQEGTKRRDPGAWAHHDDRRVAVLRQGETVGTLNVDEDLAGLVEASAEPCRGDAEPLAAIERVADGVDGEAHPARIGFRRG